MTNRYSNETQKEWTDSECHVQRQYEEMTLPELICWVTAVGAVLGLIFGLWLTQ